MADLLGLKDQVRGAQLVGSDPGRIHPALHLADFVSAALKGQHPAREKSHDQIIRGEIGLLLVLLDEKADPDGLLIVLRIMEPVLHAGWPGNIFRKVDEVFRSTVPNVEEGFLPGPDRLQTGEFEEGAPLAGRENAPAAPDERFGGGRFLSWIEFFRR